MAQLTRAARQAIYRAIPRRHYIAMSGRTRQALDQQARNQPLPLTGPTIDLTRWIPAVHQLLERAAIATEPAPSGGSLEEYRRERAELAKLERLERERELMPRAEVRQTMAVVASLLRSCGEQLGRRFGPEATDAWNDHLEGIGLELRASESSHRVAS